jgi:hypothetical protein
MIKWTEFADNMRSEGGQVRIEEEQKHGCV